jgi:predicted porin
MRSASRFVRAALAVALTPLALSAQESAAQKVEVHGFGSWNYGSTDNSNLYLGGKKNGTSANSGLSLNVSSQLSDRLTVSSQFEMDFGTNGETVVDLDYVFGEWRVNDAFKLRAGQVKQPFGIYTEIFDVGTVRPFLALPQSVYGLSGMIGEAYRGVGFTGTHAMGSWEIEYDAYTGGLNRLEDETPGDSYRVLNGTTDDTLGIEGLGGESTDRLYGGRVWLMTPIAGLRFGGSSYRGENFEEGEENEVTSAYAGSLEYAASRFTLRSEYVHMWENDNDNQTGYYVEGSLRPYGKWEIAGLFDDWKADLDGPEYKDALSLLRHKELAAGVNYRFSPNFVLKLSHHWVDGNRFAMPTLELFLDRLRAGQQLERKTKTVLFGAQLSF